MSLVTDQEWAEYKAKYDKKYADPDEDKVRRAIYEKSKNRIEEHNRKFENGEVTWRMAMNHLADLTEEEMAMRAGKKVHPPTAT